MEHSGCRRSHDGSGYEVQQNKEPPNYPCGSETQGISSKVVFSTGKRKPGPGLYDIVFNLCSNIPGDVQQLCSALWEISACGDTIAKGGLRRALEQIFAHEHKGYETILKIITKQHLKVLSTLARQGGKAPMSSAFLKHSGIAQASSVRRALERLQGLQIIFYYDDEYRFVNPFFRAWLIYKKL